MHAGSTVALLQTAKANTYREVVFASAGGLRDPTPRDVTKPDQPRGYHFTQHIQTPALYVNSSVATVLSLLLPLQDSSQYRITS